MNSIAQMNPVELSAVAKTTAELVDALFSGTKAHKPTREDMIDAAIATANRLDLMLLEIAKGDPHNANIEEAQDFAQGILLNVAGYRKQINAPFIPCDCGGKCDACVAARSDEHHDRNRDGAKS